MANNWIATDEFLVSLEIIREVGNSLSQPQALLPRQLPTTNAISCGAVVLLSGYFEYFLKDIAQEYIEKINTLNFHLSQIPLTMQQVHYSGGALALSQMVKQDAELQNFSKSQDLSRRLASLHQVNGYTLAWESFTQTSANPGAETVAKLLKGLEINGGWTAINSLDKRFGRFDTFLQTFIKMRNVCAHTGRHSTPPSGQNLVDYVEKFEALAQCIDLQIALRLTEF